MNTENFVKNLKLMLDEKRLSQRRFADLIGCHESAVSKWLLGQREPNMYYIIQIIQVLDCTFEELVS